MFVMEVPYVPAQEAPVVLVQAASTSSQPDYLLKTCDEVPTAGGAVTAMNMVDPAAWLVTQVLTQSSRQVSPFELEAQMASVRLTQMQDVAHGQLVPRSPSGRVFFEYRSAPGYVGKDQAIFLAEYQGKRYKIVANMIVSVGIDENNPQCPEPQLINLNELSSGFNGFDLKLVLASYLPNPAFERDAAKARRPSTLR